jgi:hypothetical protein
VSKLMVGLMKCTALAQTPGKPTDPNAGGCVDKAFTKFNGGLDPTKGCFAKLEAKVPNDCQFTNDSATLENLVDDCVQDMADFATNPPTTTSTSKPPTTTTSTTIGSGAEIEGALTSTPGRFNYNLTLGLPGANAACNSNFPGTHACSYAELQAAETAGELVGLQDTTSMTVTSFWAIDNSQPPLQQCNDSLGTGNNWEYATADTMSRGQTVALNNGTGALGALQSSLQCNFSGNAWVGCCN